MNSKGHKAAKITLLSNINNAIKNDDEYYFSFSIKDDFKVVNIHNQINKSNSCQKPYLNLLKK